VRKNWRYEEAGLFANLQYLTLLDMTKALDENCVNSHDVVGYWMVAMNRISAEIFKKRRCGIFRSVLWNEDVAQTSVLDSVNISPETKRVIKTWNHTTGQYVLGTDLDTKTVHHDLLKMNCYAHTTSPIRRLVDVLNSIYLLRDVMELSISTGAQEFLAQWTGKLDYINASMRSIRKVQADCELVYRCMNDPEIIAQTHRGIVFDRIVKSSGAISYMVFLEHLKLLSRVSVPFENAKIQDYTEANFRIFVFEDEEKAHKKIQLQIVS
jgi:exoribonuclease R